VKFSLENVLLIAPVIGVALNGTSSVLYGSVPELVSEEDRNRAFSVFYTVTIGAGAIAPAIFGLLSDFLGIEHAVIFIAISILFVIPLTLPLKGKLLDIA
jgi:MFS family permease